MERLTIKAPSGLIHLKHDSKEFKNKAIKILSDYEDTGLTPQQITELNERDTAKAAIITGYNQAIGCKVGECPKCGTMARDYMNFCNDCGQRLEWED